MAEFGMDTIVDHNEDDDPSAEETSLINPPDTDYAVGDDAVREPDVSDSITKANKLLSEAGLPDLNTLIAQKSTGEQNADFKRVLAEYIIKEKPKDAESLDKTFAKASDWKGTSDELMQKFYDNSLPEPPVTPVGGRSVSLLARTELSRLNIHPRDPEKFTIRRDNPDKIKNGLFVRTNEGESRLTHMNDYRKFLATPKPEIPAAEFLEIFGIDKKEYARRANDANRKVKQADEESKISVTSSAIEETSVGVEFSNPAFDDPDKLVRPLDYPEEDFRKLSIPERIKATLKSVGDSIGKPMRDLLMRLKPSDYRRLSDTETWNWKVFHRNSEKD